MRSFSFARLVIAAALAAVSAFAAAQNTGTGSMDTSRAAGTDSAGNPTGRTMKARHPKKHSSHARRARHAHRQGSGGSRPGGMDGGTSTSGGTGGMGADGGRSNSGALSPSAGGAQPVTPGGGPGRTGSDAGSTTPGRSNSGPMSPSAGGAQPVTPAASR